MQQYTTKRQRLTIGALSLLLVFGAAAAARAQDPPPLPVNPANPTAPGGPIDQNIDAGENNPSVVPDTDYTPHYKGISDLWHQVGGAEFPTTDLVDGSPTDFSDGLFAVSFRNPQSGIVGGQSCHDEEGEVPEPGTETFGECVPVAYRYSDTLQLGPRWEQVDLPGGDDPGFIGAIAWISPTKALAVGGTGTYPRRERELSDEQVATCIAEGVEAAQEVGEDPRSALNPPRVETDAIGAGVWMMLPPEVRDTLAQAGVHAGDDNTLHYRPVKDSGSVAADKARVECANRLREQNDLTSGAGSARVWVYDATRSANGGWRELTGDDLPDGMGALTAADCDPEVGVEFCFAGGLGQILQWDATDGVGDFTKRFDRHAPSTNVHNPAGLRYRVREIRFVPMTRSGDRQAFAVTSGCCPGDGLGEASPERGGRILAYGCSGNDCGGAARKWYVRRYADSLNTGTGVDEEGGRGITGEPLPLDEPQGESIRHDPRRDLPDSFYSLTATQRLTGGAWALSTVASPGGAERDGESSLLTEPLCISRNGNWEHQSTTLGTNATDTDLAVELARRHWLSSARLVAGDGDVDRSSLDTADVLVPLGGGLDPARRWVGGPSDTTANETPPGGSSSCDHPSRETEDVRSDGVPDWVVGVLRARHVPGLGHAGLIYGNNLRPPAQPGTVASPCLGGDGITDPSQPGRYINPVAGGLGRCGDLDTAKVTGGDYQPTSEEKLRAWARSKYFRAPSYGLAEVDVVRDSGQGWAVGEHGALLKLDESSLRAQAAEPEPQRLGARRPAGAPDASPYDGKLPGAAGSAAGAAPALAARQTIKLAEPELIPWGSPEPTVSHEFGDGTDRLPREVAMSRDGSEGWAVGARRAGQRTTLMRWDGERWSHCDPLGIPGQLEPHPACEELRPYSKYIAKSGRPQPVQLYSVARVPYENDSDPSNDDEFELVALGSNFGEEGYPKDFAGNNEEYAAMARYREGRWQPVPWDERSAVQLTGGIGDTEHGVAAQIAFSSAEEGWIATPAGQLYHYDGEDWAQCTAEAATECGLGALASVGEMVPNDAQIVTVGDRTFLFGYRGGAAGSARRPAILSKAPGEPWSADPAHGGLDPADAEASSIIGHVSGLALVPDDDGEGYEGWAIGDFITDAIGETALLRLTERGWEPYDDVGPIEDAVGSGGSSTEAPAAIPSRARTPGARLERTTVAAFRDADGHARAIFSFRGGELTFAFDPVHERWEIANGVTPDLGGPTGRPRTITPDGRGGAWVSVRGDLSSAPPYFFRYTDRPPEPVFSEAPSPQDSPSPRFTSLAGSPDGTVWLGTASDALYRYRRGVGWDRVRVPGWDPGRVVTRPSEVHAVAVNGAGEGVAVGERGRIADISGSQVRLDQAAGGALCSAGGAPPCGTGRTLRSAAVADDGSALIGGEFLSLLWRPGGPGGAFRAIDPPRAASTATITAISMPSPSLAWLATDTGLVFRGEGAGGSWSWSPQYENANALGDPLALDDRGRSIPLRGIAVDADGEGYAVGDRGLLLHRSGEGGGEGGPWTRLATGHRESLTAVTLGANGSKAALIGGHSGLILTARSERVSVARHGDLTQGLHHVQESSGPVVGLALIPGPHDGQTEAWAALAGAPGVLGSDFPTTGPNALLHYASDPDDPLLSPRWTLGALPDAPAPREGELGFAVLGKTHCTPPAGLRCPEWSGGTNHDELVARRVVEEISGRAGQTGGPSLALFAGDALESVGQPHEAEGFGQVRLRRWAEQVEVPLADAGVPTFGVLGARDRTQAEACFFNACAARTNAGAGESSAWRAEMASAPAPWGSGDAAEIAEMRVEPVPGGDLARPLDSARGDSGAATHYAFDLVSEGEKRFRFIFADTSTGSLTGAPDGRPAEPTGQQSWLAQMLCREGEQNTNGPCTRGPTEPAVVVSTTPTYSYGPGQQETAADPAVMESLLLRGGASALISGRLGWNALYYTCTQGVHHPEPGGSYPSGPPHPGDGGCGRVLGSGGGGQGGDPTAPPGELPSNPVADLTGTGLLPSVISSSAGDSLAGTDATEGFWHGYAVVRIAADGDPTETIVEQRPLLDWVSLQADSHVVRAGKKLTLRGFGREPVGVERTSGIANQPVRFDQISTPAITHRYALLEADPDRPWLPAEGGGDCAPYACLDPNVATIDAQSGQVRAGNGQYPRTYAIAQLSVAEHSATYPLVFEPRASFRAPAPPPPVPVAVPAPPPPPAAAPPTTPQVNLPSAPVLPVLTAQALAPPPVPPSPPTFASQAPIDLGISPASLDVAPPTAVSQPPTPPVNPAPPSGARREARQRQAAAQKSGADSGEEGSEEAGDAHGRIDSADNPNAAMSRHEATALDRSRPGPSFTPAAGSDQPSAWARDALLGGGLGLVALLLALGVNTARPTPRRREPELPAPAYARAPTHSRRR